MLLEHCADGKPSAESSGDLETVAILEHGQQGPGNNQQQQQQDVGTLGGGSRKDFALARQRLREVNLAAAFGYVWRTSGKRRNKRSKKNKKKKNKKGKDKTTTN